MIILAIHLVIFLKNERPDQKSPHSISQLHTHIFAYIYINICKHKLIIIKALKRRKARGNNQYH